MSTPETFRTLRVARAERAARDVQLFELRDPDGQLLPPFAAGAHVKVHTPSGHIRQYSLSNDAEERDRYVIAVKREADGRGGSRSMADNLHEGDLLPVGEPENLFPLDARAKSFVLIAGGIGITPMLAMARTLLNAGDRKFKLYYLTRSAEDTPFLAEIANSPLKPHVVIHHDEGNLQNSYDLWPELEKPGTPTGQHVYCCGPRGLMDAVKDMTGHWPSSTVHFESFGGDTKPHADDQPFTVKLARSGVELEVPVGRSILEVARDKGIDMASSCESGTCGTCKQRLLGGEADHRDMVLLDEEKADHVMICVSRAKSGPLVIDL
ncbi:PDR/VanB family oxidoreductase [Ottowia oryzae]|uniref:Phthalate 4,5-dioxygenase n=1 Tax=Ottowia oryzae TaxID=2109914 RepID=A0A2S0MFG0_9BURK|nr:PDR/VanB family oxidoreductase [Ottowia oryzae]AVO34624.1 phthalate 4,5-dioxygenase [Ottowia oryzae]